MQNRRGTNRSRDALRQVDAVLVGRVARACTCPVEARLAGI